MKAIDRIKEIGENFQGESLHYLIGIDGWGHQICEIDGSESYCPNCIDRIVEKRNEELRSTGYEKFIDEHDCYGEFVSISYDTEFSPERDDFEICENCGCEIQVGVLFTFSQEIDHWINEDIDIDNLSDQDAYRIWTCITSEDAKERHPEKVQELIKKINNL